jgi:uncharacterized protein
MKLIEAVTSKNYFKVKELLEQGANPNESLDEVGLTPLHFAAQLGVSDICSLLIIWGAHPDSTTDEGITPLDVAISHKNHDIAILLSVSKIIAQQSH